MSLALPNSRAEGILPLGTPEVLHGHLQPQP